MGKTVGIAVVGCGFVGARHIETLVNTVGCRCACIFDKIPSRAAELGAKFGVEVAHSYADVLARRDVDAVVISLPSYLHADFGIQAAAAGKHLIVEKPIDIAVEKAEELIAAAKKHGVVMTVISQNRFIEGSMALKKALEAGMLGEILCANVAIKWYRKDSYYAESDWRGRFSGERRRRLHEPGRPLQPTCCSGTWATWPTSGRSCRLRAPSSKPKMSAHFC